MIKTISAVVVVSAVVLACSQNIFKPKSADDTINLKISFDDEGYWRIPGLIVKRNKYDDISYFSTNSLYGAYLAGRVAHLRNDYENAVEYYKIVLEKDKDNKDVNKSALAIFAYLGDIDRASVYAEKELENNPKNHIASLIVAFKDFHNGKYAETRERVGKLDSEINNDLINPLIIAWTYAAEKNTEKAVETLEKLRTPDFGSLKAYHKGLIYDYVGESDKAEECFSDIITNYPQEVTYRILDIITDFYVRKGDKVKARKISRRYNDNSSLSILLSEIDKKIDKGSAQTTAIIDTAEKGLAEALFYIGTIYRAASNGSDIAQIYTAASSYLNPGYDITKIASANILEGIGLLDEANRFYKEISKESGSYFIARLKLIDNLNTLKKYDEAEQYLRDLLKDYPDNSLLLSDLGDIASKMNKHNEAIKIYKKAIDSSPSVSSKIWPIYFSLAISYDLNNQKQEAEENLQKALELSRRNPSVLNYLGYSWLTKEKNTDEAIQMILEAYSEYPYEYHIIDSMGWVYYKTGNYQKSIELLEQASNLNPANAVISDHLGDAYWFGGRKNEAVFQWQHALDLKEDSETLDKSLIEKKIEDGIVENKVITINDKKLLKVITDFSISDGVPEKINLEISE